MEDSSDGCRECHVCMVIADNSVPSIRLPRMNTEEFDGKSDNDDDDERLVKGGQ